MKNLFLLIIVSFIFNFNVFSQVNGRMLREPDVSKTHITFVYAGDIWIVPKDGGIAVKLSSPKGKESFPRFSPDGKTIAFSGNYDGNVDVYTIPFLGGVPKRITYHPSRDRVLDWYPDGKKIIFASTRKSGRTRFNQFYSVSKEGGLPEILPVPYGEFASLSKDVKTLAYTPKARDFRHWKRYRGGGTSDIWLFDLKKRTAKNITKNIANDGHPMWYGNYLYFLSDRDINKRANIWKYNRKTGKVVQITKFSDYDITFPAIGNSDIVFENGGFLYLLNLKTDRYKRVNIKIVNDFASLKPHLVNVGKMVRNATVSPDGKRVIMQARGELFTVPVKYGFTKNLTGTSGVAELIPSWSPDAKTLAYWSDKSGEYELYFKDMSGKLQDKKVTNLGKGYRYYTYWSPDSKKLAFIDNQNYMFVLDIKTNKITKFGRQKSQTHNQLQNFRFSWSSDSNWLAYSKQLDNKQQAVFIYDVKNKINRQVTSGFYNDYGPEFDTVGKYLYFITDRALRPTSGSLDDTWLFMNSAQIAVVPLRNDMESPLKTRNDSVKIKEEKKSDKKKDKTKKSNKIKTIKIDFDGFESRLIVLTKSGGNYGNLRAVKGKLLYIHYSNTGEKKRNSVLEYYDIKKRKSEKVVSGVGSFEITANKKKIFLSQRGGKYHIIDIRPKQRLKGGISTKDMMMNLNPKEEWSEILTDVWRKYRDFFHDKYMHGLDWEAVKRAYENLLKDAVTREDLNFILGELIAELNSSHTYVGGGEVERGKRVGVGLLGIDWGIENNHFKIIRIVDGAPWDNEVRSPLKETGLKVNKGDYILAVNGVRMNVAVSPYSYFEGLAHKTVELTVNDEPNFSGSRKIIVKTLGSEVRLRNLEWINNNRKWAEKYSKGKIGYIYMPDTASSGLNELIRQYYGQLDKEGFIIDERFNNGGNLPDRFIELLTRKTSHFIDRRNGPKWNSFEKANGGPKVMLINGWSVSGGDAFPYVFKSEKVGPIVGMRTVGGLIGPTVGHLTIDGGFFTVPSGRIFGYNGKWFPEGWGIEPDIKVVDDPAILAKGIDPQLKAGVEEALRLLKKNPPIKVKTPKHENRTAKGIREEKY